MRWLALAICIWAVAVVAAGEPLAQHLLQRAAINQDIINTINSDASATWTAGVNSKFEHATLADAKRLLGVLPGGKKLPPKPDALKLGAPAPPASFDWRTHALAAKCPSLNEVRDQSDCGSCWALGVAESITDRICIASNGTKQFHVSAADLMSCCGFYCGDGCKGGWPDNAFSYWHKTGLHTGGNYNNTLKDNGCVPYPFAPCAHHTNSSIYPACPSTIEPTPACPKKCSNGESWAKTVSKGASSYTVGFDDTVIASEIFNYGPCEASYDVYEDFLTYKSGVYSHVTGKALGGHAVKILGWGTENGVKYWLVANSWNEDWGDHGYFKIKKGTNECNIEDAVFCGEP